MVNHKYDRLQIFLSGSTVAYDNLKNKCDYIDMDITQVCKKPLVWLSDVPEVFGDIIGINGSDKLANSIRSVVSGLFWDVSARLNRQMEWNTQTR